MNRATCNQIREQLLEFVSPVRLPLSQVEDHVRECASCAAELAALRRTCSVLDEWQAPEPSPFFDMRLQAKLREMQREEKLAPQWQGIFAGLNLRWQPALAAALAIFLAIGGIAYRNGHQTSTEASVTRGTGAAADLQALDKNDDIYNFNMLYDDGNQNQDSGANP